MHEAENSLICLDGSWRVWRVAAEAEAAKVRAVVNFILAVLCLSLRMIARDVLMSVASQKCAWSYVLLI